MNPITRQWQALKGWYGADAFQRFYVDDEAEPMLRCIPVLSAWSAAAMKRCSMTLQ